jgi:sigma-B regulation protein RsbU (phosphoserine phosphatase)
MVLNLALVISEPTVAAVRLCALLNQDGLPARQVPPGPVLAGWTAEDGVPDLVLVSAAMDLDLVRRVVQRIRQATNRLPTLVTFSNTAVGDLDDHIRAGFDYIVPPFVPGLVVSRLLASHIRQALARSPEEIRVNADLVYYERELRIGQEIQAGFLPEALPVRAGWQLTARFQPARVVAGDFYDAFELLDGARIGLVVADVCDKGVGAALFMALVRSLLRHTATHLDGIEAPPPAGSDAALLLRTVVTTNDYLTANHLAQGYFATLFFAVLDPLTGSLVYANCGHNAPVLRRADGVRCLLRPTGPALGLMPESVFAVDRTRLELGDLLFAYTDGVPEAKDVGGRFLGWDVMHDLVAGHRDGAEDLLDLFDRTISAHVGTAEQSDDITMIALHRERTGQRG